jgi:hypothetical protein
MSLYVKLSAEYPTDDEFIEAGPMAELLYIRGLCFCKRKQLDGRISTAQLGAVAYGMPNARKLAALLVDVGLWRAEGAGWSIPGWFKWNKSAAEIEEDREMRRRASLEANHAQHHIGDGKRPSPKCEICRADNLVRTAPKSAPKSEANRRPDRLQEQEQEQEEEPKPEEEQEEEQEQEPGRRPSTTTTAAPPRRDDDDRMPEVINGIADELVTRFPPKASPKNHRNAIVCDIRSKHGEAIRTFLADNPDTPATTVAARFLLDIA